MILSKAVRSSVSAHGHRSSSKLPECKAPNSIPDFLQLLDARDYKGAITVLQFQRMGRRIHVRRKRLNGWHTRISTTASTTKHCWCTESFWTLGMPTRPSTHLQLRASSTWPPTKRPSRQHSKVRSAHCNDGFCCT